MTRSTSLFAGLKLKCVIISIKVPISSGGGLDVPRTEALSSMQRPQVTRGPVSCHL